MTLPEDFAEFWNAFPKRRGKLDAERAYKLARTRASADDILRGLAWQVDLPDWHRDGGRFCPYPATWLRAGRWLDEPDAVPQSAAWECPHTPRHNGRSECHTVSEIAQYKKAHP